MRYPKANKSLWLPIMLILVACVQCGPSAQDNASEEEQVVESEPEPDFIITLKSEGTGKDFVLHHHIHMFRHPFGDGVEIEYVKVYHLQAPGVNDFRPSYGPMNRGDDPAYWSKGRFELGKTYGTRTEVLELFLKRRGRIIISITFCPSVVNFQTRDAKNVGFATVGATTVIDPVADTVDQVFKGRWKKEN